MSAALVALSLLLYAKPAKGEAGQAGQGPPADLFSHEALYSNHNVELIARDFVQDRRGGFYLDVRCWHPIKDSNTYYLEKHLGWRGIGVDALPELAPKWTRHRRESKFLNYIVTDHDGTVESFYRVDLTDISQVQKPAVGPGGDPVKSEEIHVRTATLNTLLDREHVKEIDFFSIDIEGHEPAALAGFDIDRFRPKLVCIEAKPQNREFISKYFADHGYERLEKYRKYDEVNYYFTPKGPTP